MDSSRIAVATMTWARSDADARRLLASLRRLTALGLPTAVADRSDDPAMRQQLSGLDVVLAPPGAATLVAQIQASVALAAGFGRPFIFYTEPDKDDFFAHGARRFLALAPDHADIGVILAGRSAESFQTFPPLQRYTESVINHLCGDVVGRAGDYAYGPLLFARALAPFVAALDPRVGWGWRTAVVHAAHRCGLHVLEVTGNYPCPADQLEETTSERALRLRQLSENVLGLSL